MIDPAQIQQPVQPVIVQPAPQVSQTPNGAQQPVAATTAPNTASAVVSQVTQTTATAPDRATAVAAVDQAVSGIGQAIGSDLAKTPTAVAGVVLAVIVVAVIAAILGFGYLLVQSVSGHNATAAGYVSAIGDRALTVGAVLLGAAGLLVAPSPITKK